LFILSFFPAIDICSCLTQCCQYRELDRKSRDLTISLDKNELDRRWDRSLTGSERSGDRRAGSDDPWPPQSIDAAQKQKTNPNLKPINPNLCLCRAVFPPLVLVVSPVLRIASASAAFCLRLVRNSLPPHCSRYLCRSK